MRLSRIKLQQKEIFYLMITSNVAASLYRSGYHCSFCVLIGQVSGAFTTRVVVCNKNTKQASFNCLYMMRLRKFYRPYMRIFIHESVLYLTKSHIPALRTLAIITQV